MLDAELLRLRLRVARDLSPSAFVMADVAVQGSYAGFLDGFLDWYHNLLGITLEARELRPQNEFLYRDGAAGPRGAHAATRATCSWATCASRPGLRRGPHFQAIATVTLPTSTGPTGYGRGVVAGGVIATVRAPLAKPLIYEGSLGLGYTPTHGDLTAYQHTTFVSVSSGMRWRFWGRQSLYANLFYHSPYYHDTTLPSLDRRELSLDFGWILATKSGQRVADRHDRGPGAERPGDRSRVSAGGGPLTVRCRPDPP